MADDPRVEALLEELLNSRGDAEEICRDCPELLPQVRAQWRRVREIQTELGVLFPDSAASDDAIPPAASVSQLPKIADHQLLEVLGRGGMGVVYKALDLRLHRPVAVKMLLAGPFARPQERERFVREARAAAGLNHSNIVQIYEVGNAEGQPYFTMEFVEGGSLAQKLAGAPQPARQAAQLVATLAAAVSYAHDHGIVHRDLKPGNILFTTDRMPKIVDFGLARRVDAKEDLTISGARLGTPSYMAPEQASGKSSLVGPATDVYSLGAVLYEMLTGRPPFRADTLAETQRQLIAEDPVRPSRLNASVPRDLENICLKCLHKEPQRRYVTAHHLAEDLQRFLESKPVLARPISLSERTWKWARRRPSAAALVATSFALFTFAIAGGFWFERQRSAQREERARQEGRASQGVEDALVKAAALEEQGNWPAARQLLIGAAPLVAETNNPGLQQRLERARKDAHFVTTLEEIRMRVADAKRSRGVLSTTADKLYADAFRDYGLPVSDLRPNEAAQQIRRSNIRDTLLSFLHDWLFDGSDANRPKVQGVVDRADDNEWRRAIRLALSASDSGRLKALVSAPEAELQPAIVYSGLIGALHEKAPGNEVMLLLHKVQRRHSEDFWINYLLGDFLVQDHPQEAVGYLSAAIGLRPDSSHAYLLLGRVLRDTGDASGAIPAFRMAVSLDPSKLGSKDVARALATKGDLHEAREIWEKVLATNPPDHDRWHGYAALCLFLGNEEAYARGRRALLLRTISDSDHWTVVERNSLSCLLRPAAGDERQSVLKLVARANQMAPKYPHPDNAYVQFISGFSEYRLGHFAQAIPVLQEAAAILPNRPGARLVLAMAQFQAGETGQARKSLAIAVRGYNREERQANSITGWTSHVLRREAEAMILPHLAAFLAGRYQPRDNDERLALLGMTQFQGQFSLAARLYSDAFRTDPQLADELTIECRLRGAGLQGANERFEVLNTEGRYLAARCAALAASDPGHDKAALSDAQRADLRRLARDWLLADLSVWRRILDNGSDNDHELTKRMLTFWEVDSDLVCLRDTQAVDKLPADEREKCHELWHQVRALRDRAREQRVDPAKRAEAHTARRKELIEQRRLEEARVLWQSDLEYDPPEHDAWHGYAELCLFLGHEDDFRRARRALLVRFGASTDPFVAERAGRACLLMASSGDARRAALALVNRAVWNRADERWVRSCFEFARGLGEYRDGHFDKAISIMRGDPSRVLGPAPGLVLAMCLQKSGRKDEARKALAAAILDYDWRTTQTRDPGSWMFHPLRREAERAVLPNMMKFLEGSYQPADNSERLALLGVCQAEDRWRAAARLFADAFQSHPALPDRLNEAGLARMPWRVGTMNPVDVYRSSSRSGAARCAALAGCGLGKDGADLSAPERTHWRKQSLKWLEDDLAMWKKMLDSDSPQAKALAAEILADWESDQDLAGLREPHALDQLPPDERTECRALWRKVRNVLEGAAAGEQVRRAAMPDPKHPTSK